MKLITDGDRLIISLQGMEIVWSLRKRLEIPRSSIQNLSWADDYIYHGNRFFRVGGTGVPGVLIAGNFVSRGKKYFLYIKRPWATQWLFGKSFTAKNVLDIEVTNYRYDRIIITCDNTVAGAVTDWFKAK